MPVSRSLLGSILAIGVVVASSATALSQDQSGEAVGPGGRIEVPEAGFAVTLPDDWTYVRPQASDVETIVDAVESVDPSLAAMVEASLGGNFDISLIGFAPILFDAFTENCNVVTGATNGLSLEWIAAANMAQMEALEWDAELTMDVLPAGDVARIDYGAAFGELELEQSLWVYVDDDTQQNLTCTTNEQRPADSWRPIAETLEFLPAE